MQSLRSRYLLTASLLILAACGEDAIRQVEETDTRSDTTVEDTQGSGTDTTPDGSGSGADTGSDTDTTVSASCGDGKVDEGETCDDGNRTDGDGCNASCFLETCGDGAVNASYVRVDFESPVVRNPFGSAGHVCSQGATCPGETCDVSTNPTAPEHGICEALGYDAAVSATWGNGARVLGEPNPRAANWACDNYDCGQGADRTSTGDCLDREMLASITCVKLAQETCDDGAANSDTAADSCRTNCTAARCGDGVVDTGETCDDGNTVAGDGCAPACRPTVCGDGVLDPGEGCDDGNTVDTDDCTNSCQSPRCGDGVVSSTFGSEIFSGPTVTGPTGATGHICDDGSNCFAGTCDVSLDGSAPEHGICQSLGFSRAVTVTWGGGPGEADSAMPHAYNWECFGYVCTASTNSFDTDNCSASEMLNAITCEGGIQEQCDLAGANSSAPDATCRPDCTTQRCGDGVTDTGEACDDGNLNEFDTCTSSCENIICGDGVINGRELCDDGLLNSDLPDGICRTDCTVQRCGDTIVDTEEQCDDGNTVNTDDCSNACTTPVCGDAIVQAGEECDDGNLEDTDACRVGCIAARCGDGITNAASGALIAPIVTDPTGATGHVCDDGGSCFGPCTIDVSEDGFAPEHGICQSLGFARAESVSWGNGPGEADVSMPHAFNWSCIDFVCTVSDFPSSSDNCGVSEMLNSITCVGSEACDLGDANSDAPDALCRSNCQPARCGDSILDTGEFCDDGNNDDNDGCTSVCQLPYCGDGVISIGEDCDDGNTDDSDLCLTSCIAASCGDAINNNGRTTRTFTAPRVTNPFGETGPVCQVGATCPAGGCDLGDLPFAPEHGICEALGYERADAVVWGGSTGAAVATTPHAGNWGCDNFDCAPGTDVEATDLCGDTQMLDTITCSKAIEQCDLGTENSLASDATCRPDCLNQRCGDGVRDTDEVCDDGNANNGDLCTSSCQEAFCGDGFRQSAAGEQCDDGNFLSGDGCDPACQREAGSCAILVVSDPGVPATSITALQTVLLDASLPAEFVSNTATTFSTADSVLLSGYSIVILNKSDRELSAGERDVLEDFLAGGGVFIATGYDSLGSPTDAVLAGLLRITTTGDAFPDPACEVTDNSDLAFDGTYGTFPLGYTFTSLGGDFDGAGASAALGSRELIRMGDPLGGTFAKLTVADSLPGTAYYWNGNQNYNDWTTPAASTDMQAMFLNMLVGYCF